jgi:hypothetical protein
MNRPPRHIESGSQYAKTVICKHPSSHRFLFGRFCLIRTGELNIEAYLVALDPSTLRQGQASTTWCGGVPSGTHFQITSRSCESGGVTLCVTWAQLFRP